MRILVTGGSQGIGAAVARLAGARGYAVALTYQSNKAMADAVVADIAVDPAENCFPMIPSGAAHNEMILAAGQEQSSASVTDAGMALV